MIIHSPHLCGLPGFRADHSDVEMAKIRCREVISDSDFEKWVSGEEVVMPFLTIGQGEEWPQGPGATKTHMKKFKWKMEYR
jgi:protein OS-9